MSNGIYVLLGTNMGDRRLQLTTAQDHISAFAHILRKSSIYSTKAWGNTDQPDFLNQVIEVGTTLEPEQLLEELLATELKMGRSRKGKWGPRSIDLDVLLYGDRVIDLPQLTVPHPEIQNRKFTLVPLRELAPMMVHPVLNKTMSQLDDECGDKLEVVKGA